MASDNNPTSGNSSDNGDAGDYGGYYRTRNRLFDWYGHLLGPIPIAAYHYLDRCADKNGYCFPSYETIAFKCGMSRRAAIDAIAKLTKYKLIEIERRKNRQERRNNYTSNRYKIRLEAFTHAGAHKEVVHLMHQLVHHTHQLVHEVHSKDNPLRDNPPKEREEEPPPSTPLTLSTSLNSSQGETSQTAGKNPEAATAQSPGGDPSLGSQDQAVEAETRAKGKKKPAASSRGSSAGESLPADWALPADDIEAAIQETGWTEAEVKRVSGKFRDHRRSKGTLSHDWQAEWHLWLQREIEYVRANGKVERTAPRPPVFVAEPKAAIDLSKPRLSHKATVLAEIARVTARP